jgi:hypothetical protein
MLLGLVKEFLRIQHLKVHYCLHNNFTGFHPTPPPIFKQYCSRPTIHLNIILPIIPFYVMHDFSVHSFIQSL